MSNREPFHPLLLEEVERLRARNQELEGSASELEQMQARLKEGSHLVALSSEVSIALIERDSLNECLQHCAQALVTHLEAAFARVWLLNTETQTLELVASAGLYVHLDGPHSRIQMGAFKIGRIAAEQQPHLTNAVVNDPQVSDQEWARREGMVAFAGYPLLLNGEVLGVMALFARHVLSSSVLDAMATVSRSIALGIEHKRIEAERTHLFLLTQEIAGHAERENARLESILDKLPDGFMVFDEQWRYSYINPQAAPYTGLPWQELLGKNVWEVFPALVGSLYDQYYHHAMLHQEPVAFEIFNVTLSQWFDTHAYPIPGGLAVYFRNITSRKEVEAERVHFLEMAETARQEAEAALQVRNDFISSISHDLKTPLAVMQGNAQLLQRRLKRDTPVEPLWATERLAVIENAIRKMHGMIEDLLDVATLQTGQQLDLQLHPISLRSLIQQICEEQQETTRRHRLLLEMPPGDLFVQADHLRLDRALTNVLTNAIKYSPEGGSIRVTLASEEEGMQQWMTIGFQDEGLGIPEGDLPFIFDPFYRATNVKRQIIGTGIGLASVAQVMKEHGGSISVKSEEGQGSCFVVRLPALSGQ